MQAPEAKIPGTRDYVGAEAIAMRAARDAIEATLRSYAYAPIDAPVLESPSPFLNRSGEDIRRHMYIFPDPAGREVCLRPELTIPVCRAYLRQLQAAPKAKQTQPPHQARVCYFGPAFRYETSNDRGDRQFYQAGAELIGSGSPEAADAEILAVALDALAAAGVTETSVEMADVDIRNAFIDQLPIDERSKTRIWRSAMRNREQSPAVAATSAHDAVDESGNGFGELAALLASATPGKAARLIREVLALADVRHVGGRTAEEIVERLTSRSAQQTAQPISAELTQGVLQLFNIRGKPETAFAAIREHFRTFGIGGIEPILQRCEKRLRYFEAYRQSPGAQNSVALKFNVGLRRGLEYYTGFLFEAYVKSGPVCGGGRYDNLFEGLGSSVSIPAVGFAIGLDRLLPALREAYSRDAADRLTPQALVNGLGPRGYEQSMRVSAALRAAGWSVELDLSDSDERSCLAYAAKRKIRYVIFADAAKKSELRVRRTDKAADQTMSLAALVAHARRERADASPDATV